MPRYKGDTGAPFRGHHLATDIPLEGELTRDYGEWCGNDPTANLPEGHEESPSQ